MTSLIDKALSCVGLMRVAEHEREVVRLNGSLFDALTKSAEWEAKYKQAAADLEKQAGEIADWRTALKRMEGDRDNWRAQALRDEPDALAMRRKRQMDRDRRKGRV